MQINVVAVVLYLMKITKREKIAALKQQLKQCKRGGYYPEYYDIKGQLYELERHW